MLLTRARRQSAVATIFVGTTSGGRMPSSQTLVVVRIKLAPD